MRTQHAGSRRDGKARRASTGYGPTKHNGIVADPPQSWEELVRPGPAPDPVKVGDRLAARRRGRFVLPEGDGRRRERRAFGNRRYPAGRVDLHRTRMKPLPRAARLVELGDIG